MAGEYIFNTTGNTAAVAANSVNVLQDQWADEHLGLLRLGVRIGRWNQYKNYLESHIFGDPTFRFQPDDINTLTEFLAEDDHEDLLNSGSVPIRALAVAKLEFEDKNLLTEKLYDIATSDPAGTVRLQALKQLIGLGPDNLNDLLIRVSNDPFELIRRFSIIWMGDIGRAEFLPVLIDRMLFDISVRVRFNAKKSVEKIGTDQRFTELENALSTLRESPLKSDLRARSLNSFNRSDQWLYEELLVNLRNKDLALKKRLSAARTFRTIGFIWRYRT